MSLQVHLDKVSNENREKISNDLKIKLESKFGPPKYFYPYDLDSNDNLILPFAYASNLGIKRPSREKFTNTNIVFESELRPEQKEVKKEAISILNKTGSVLISSYPGWGKCLGYDTPIIMYDGTIKKVQDIVVGDKLMGDDSTVRNVLSVCRGQENMYKIVQSIGDTFTCNESHILSLYITDHKKITYNTTTENYTFEYFDSNTKKYNSAIFHTFQGVIDAMQYIPEQKIINISIKEYLQLDINTQKKLKLYKVSIELPDKNVKENPYIIGQKVANKKLDHIPDIYKYNSLQKRRDLLDGILSRSYPDTEKVYDITITGKTLLDDILYVTRSVGYNCYYEKELNNTYIIFIYKGINYTDFIISSIPEKDYYGFTIDGNHLFLLGDFTVTHNTITAINIASTINLKTLIIVNKIVLMNQWEESINRFCPSALVQKVTTKSELDEEADFYIVNAINVEKLGKYFFESIGCLLVDEVHLIMAETLSKSLNYVRPRYLIGLSATPYRPDGLDILLELYCGSNKIIRNLYRKHIVYKIETGLKPVVEMAKNGKVNWSSILDQQATDTDRNELIVKIIKKFQDRVFMILVKRIDQGKYLFERLEEEGESVTSLLGSQQEFNKEARILIGTTSKIGVGFSWDIANTLIAACDIEEYFIQYLGRIFRTKEGEPMVFDLVDNNSILKNHFNTRKSVYIDHGGIVKNYDKRQLDA